MLANPSPRTPNEIATELQIIAISARTPGPSSPASPSDNAANQQGREQKSITAECIAARTASSGQAEANYLIELVEAAFAALPNEAKAVKAGHEGVVNKILGWIMKKSRGRVDAAKTRALVKEMVGKK